ncbi:MAG TPA: hypothetical protein VL401_04180, partial [Alphaproteobacteria bacterium]|nr:hypothetical protein [Alphaproteobacteria bacterium]
LGVVERQLRNANSVEPCPNPDTNTITYTDQNGISGSFSCNNIGAADSYIASASARLTNSDITITSCSFMCTAGTAGNPPFVSVSLEAEDATAVGVQNSKVTTSTQIYLRSY